MTAMIILLSNDDGIHAEGIIVLEKSLEPLAEVYTVVTGVRQTLLLFCSLLTLGAPL